MTHENDGRYSISVEAEDGSTGVQWAVSEGLGFGIDEDAVQAFADLQRQYPGTTGWVDAYGSETKGSVRFSPEDVSLDAVSAGLIDPALFTSLEVGWGPAVEDAATFAETYSEPLARDVVTAVSAIEGVTELDVYDTGRGMQATVTADSGTAVQRALALAPGLDASVAVLFSRAPVLFRDAETPVFTVNPHTPPAHIDAYLALAELPAIREVILVADRGMIAVDHEATDEELATAFKSLLALPQGYGSTEVHVVFPGVYGDDDRYLVGTGDREGFRLEHDPAATDTVEEPAKRVAKAWDAALG